MDGRNTIQNYRFLNDVKRVCNSKRTGSGHPRFFIQLVQTTTLLSELLPATGSLARSPFPCPYISQTAPTRVHAKNLHFTMYPRRRARCFETRSPLLNFNREVPHFFLLPSFFCFGVQVVQIVARWTLNVQNLQLLSDISHFAIIEVDTDIKSTIILFVLLHDIISFH